MNAPEAPSTGFPSAPTKKPVWPLNVAAVLFVTSAIVLSSPDPLTRIVTIVSLSLSLVACCFSLYRRFNLLGLVLLVGVIYHYASFLLFIFRKG